MLKSTLILLVLCTIFQLSFSPNHQFPPHMNSRTCSWFSKFNLFFTLILLVLFQSHNISSNRDDELYQTCGNVFSCGDKITGIEYPFLGAGDPPHCGHPDLVLSCDFEQNVTTINMVNITYRVLEIHQTEQIMRIVREDVVGGSCPVEMVNTTLDHSLFDYTDACTNLTFLYGCNWTSSKVPGLVHTSCQSKGHNVYALPGTQGPGICDTSVVVPVLGNGAGGLVNATALHQVVEQGFEIMWNIDSQACRNCTGSNGRCGYDTRTNQTTCFCPDPPYVSGTCPIANRAPPGITRTSAGNGSNSRAMYIGIPVAGALLASVALAFLVFYCKTRRKLRGASNSAKILSKEITPPPSSQSLTTPASTDFTRSIPYSSPSCNLGNVSCYFGAKLFDYTELEEATHNFNASRELGDGAFGVVYYGELSDGRKVAVKRLYETNFRRVEQFMNEVEILTRLRHDNLVTLHGCTSRRSRELLLVYEYIPNGTVGDHLHGKQAKSGLLSWPVRLNIAIETAEALTYLHKSGIVHRDVKTNNILLDNDFHVKVADFGLSRLFPTNATHVSTAPQGTPGYVDPEYYQCYQLTEKSDVYSFGVVLIELISSLPAVDTNRHRHDINLGNMAMNRIQDNKVHELVDRSLGFETNSMVRRMATSVVELAFRCLQQEREVRPLMDEVLEGLRGITNEDLNTINVAFVDIMVDKNAAPSKEDKSK